MVPLFIYNCSLVIGILLIEATSATGTGYVKTVLVA